MLAKNGQPITKSFNPLPPAQLRSHAPDNSDKSDDNHESESECEEYFNYGQLIMSIENELKQNNHDSGYKLRLTVLLQYLRLVNHQELKIKASLCIAQQLNKGLYFACCLRV